MRKYSKEIEEFLGDVDAALKSFFANHAKIKAHDLNAVAVHLGFKDHRQMRAVVASAYRDDMSIKTHLYRDSFMVINEALVSVKSKHTFKIERITRARKHKNFWTSEEVKKLLAGETVTLANGESFVLTKITVDDQSKVQV